jgi:PAS domain-containing protein
MERRSKDLGGRRLTDRQVAILDLVAAGRENKEIAFELGISEQAVKEHVSRLLQLLAAPNRAALGDAAATQRFSGSFAIDPEWLRFFFQDAPVHAAIVSGPDHRFVAANDATNVAAGGRELIGLTFRAVFPERGETLELLDRAYTTGQRVAASELPARFVRDGVAQDGYVVVVLQPLPGPDGTTNGIAIFSIDVSESVRARQRVEELEKEQYAILDSITTAVVVTDIDGVVIKANELGRTLLQLPSPPVTLATELAATYDLRDPIDDRRIPIVESPVLRALRGERIDGNVYRISDPQVARERLLRISSVPLLDADGTVRGSVTTFAEA